MSIDLDAVREALRSPHVLIWMRSTGRHVTMTIHGLSLSTQSLALLHTHAHILSGRDKHKRGWA